MGSRHPEQFKFSPAIRVFTASEIVESDNQALYAKILDLDRVCYGAPQEDPFYLDYGTTHLLTSHDDGELVGALSLTLRKNASESEQLARAIEILEPHDGVVDFLNNQVQAVVLTNGVSSRHGAMRAMIAHVYQELKPNMMVGYSYNHRIYTALRKALFTHGFSMSMGGVPIMHGQPVSPMAYCFNQAVAEWMNDYLDGNGSKVLTVPGEDYHPEAIVYPERLRGQYLTESRLGRVGAILRQVEAEDVLHGNPEQSVTIHFQVVHSSIDSILQ